MGFNDLSGAGLTSWATDLKGKAGLEAAQKLFLNLLEG